MMMIVTIAEWIGSIFLISISIALIGFGMILMVVAIDMFKQWVEINFTKKGE